MSSMGTAELLRLADGGSLAVLPFRVWSDAFYETEEVRRYAQEECEDLPVARLKKLPEGERVAFAKGRQSNGS